MRRHVLAAALPIAALALAPRGPAQSAPAALDRYDVVWTSPSASSAASMPIGNGSLGANVWVEPSGELVLLLAHTDAWSEAARLLKLGRVRVAFGAGPLTAFEQRLRLRDGRIEVTATDAQGAFALEVFVDPDEPVLHVVGRGAKGADAARRAVRVSYETWRTEERRLTGDELESSWAMRGAPADVEVRESADVVLDGAIPALCAYHRADASIVPFTLRRQGLGEAVGKVPDPLTGRTSGVWIEGDGLEREDGAHLASAAPLAAFHLRVAGLARQTPDAARWIAAARAAAAGAGDVEAARRRTARWWNDRWDRSWILVEGDPDAATDCAGPSRVTQAWLLQRWMTLCAGRGESPIKFNGSIFNVEPAPTGGQPFDADWRRWGGDLWWQNTRLPYFAALARGDFEVLPALYGTYERALPLARERARRWYGVEGAWFPETMTIFGAYPNADYGWQRAGLEPRDVQCAWWRWAWQQGLELLELELEHHAYTQEPSVVREHVLPLAHDVLRWFDARCGRDERGKLVLSPTQAVETYWDGVVNDAPTVAGLRAVTQGLLALPEGVGAPEDRALWARLAAACPDVPTRTEGGVELLAAAERHEAQRQNCETPELYAVFPFPLYGVGRPGLELARAAYERRHDRSHVGWTQDGIFAARLGLADEARDDVVARARNQSPAHRFPAMWGPNFDWLPDQCHGANLQNVLQSMLIQPVGDTIHLMPAWPRAWDVVFRLHAPGRTVVTGIWREGRWERLEVDPPARRRDVRLHLSE